MLEPQHFAAVPAAAAPQPARDSTIAACAEAHAALHVRDATSQPAVPTSGYAALSVAYAADWCCAVSYCAVVWHAVWTKLN
jgi:hypothetical protein